MEINFINGVQIQQLNNYYFTFGSDERYPYPNRYVIVKANNLRESCIKFRTRFPDREDNKGILNCAFYYDEDEWNKSCKKYYPFGPAETII